MARRDGAEAVTAWLDAVANGSATMSQRQVAWAEENGGIEVLVKQARGKGVYLARLTDDKGVELLVANRHPFTALC